MSRVDRPALGTTAGTAVPAELTARTATGNRPTADLSRHPADEPSPAAQQLEPRPHRCFDLRPEGATDERVADDLVTARWTRGRMRRTSGG